MKNLICSLIGCLLLLFSCLLAMSFYQIVLRKNELTQVVSEAMYLTLEEYCIEEEFLNHGEKVPEEDMATCVEERICSGLNLEKDPEIIVYAADPEMGILSVEVREVFGLPIGSEKTITCRRTLLADRSFP